MQERPREAEDDRSVFRLGGVSLENPGIWAGIFVLTRGETPLLVGFIFESVPMFLKRFVVIKLASLSCWVVGFDVIVPRFDLLLGSMPTFWFKISGPLGFLVSANEMLDLPLGVVVFGFGLGDNDLPLPSFGASELLENC